MFCEQCGQKITDGSLFCEYCGAKIEVQPQVQAQPQVEPQVQVQAQVQVQVQVQVLVLATEQPSFPDAEWKKLHRAEEEAIFR